MSESRRIRTLGRLVDLRDREVERCSADVAERQALTRRYLDNLTRLEQLWVGSGPSSAPTTGRDPSGAARAPAFSPALSLNCGSYKQAVMKMADAHRVDLSLHEAETALARNRLLAAARRREALDAALERERRIVNQFRTRAERRRQDEVASQAWARGRR